jgi:crotonobetainyl-CoA:carnitine CoA-transferase CaiB-like acyl-CoA transferase
MSMNSPSFAGAPDRAPRNSTLLPENLRVLELGEAVSTALCGRLLSKLGAQVTQVAVAGSPHVLDESGPFVGDRAHRVSALGVWLRDGKARVEVDPEDPTARGHLDELVRSADVVLLAGTAAEWSARGFSAERLEDLAPTAIIGRISPWGESEEAAGLPSNELALQAASGFMRLIGDLEHEPVRLAGHPLQSIAALLALDGVMIGLFARERTGQGARFTTSEFEAAVHAEWKIATFAQAGLHRELRGEDNGALVLRCRDGHFAAFYVPRDWGVMKEIIGDSRLDDEVFDTPQGRIQNQERLVALIEETTRTMSKKDLYHATQARGIPAGYVATVTDLFESPQYAARRFFEPVEVPGVGDGLLPDASWQVFGPEDAVA